MVPSISFYGRERRHADKIFAFPAGTEFSVTTGAIKGQLSGGLLVSRFFPIRLTERRRFQTRASLDITKRRCQKVRIIAESLDKP